MYRQLALICFVIGAVCAVKDEPEKSELGEPSITPPTVTPAEHTTIPIEQVMVPGEHATVPTEHATTPAEHATTLAEHATTLAEHEPTPVEHATTTDEHTTTLAEHATTLAEHEPTPVEHATTTAEHATTTAEHATTSAEPIMTAAEVSAMIEDIKDEDSPPEHPTFMGSPYVIPNLMTYSNKQENWNLKQIFQTLNETPIDIYKEIDLFIKQLLPKVENLRETNLIRKFITNADTILRFFENYRLNATPSNQWLIELMKLVAANFLKLMDEMSGTAKSFQPDVDRISSPTLKVHHGAEEPFDPTLVTDPQKAKAERIHFGTSKTKPAAPLSYAQIDDTPSDEKLKEGEDVSETIVHHAEGKTTRATQTELSESTDEHISAGVTAADEIISSEPFASDKTDVKSTVASSKEVQIDPTQSALLSESAEKEAQTSEKLSSISSTDEALHEPQDTALTIEELAEDKTQIDPIPSTLSESIKSDPSKVTEELSSLQEKSSLKTEIVGAPAKSESASETAETRTEIAHPKLTSTSMPVELTETSSALPGLVTKPEETEKKGDDGKTGDTSLKR